MLDFLNFPNQQENVTIFYANGSAWQTWKKPRNCKYVWMMCIGGGAGGNGGRNIVSSIQSGSASGAVTKALFNANLIPDILYVQVGLGGLGATTSNGIGSSGNRSFVSLGPLAQANILFCTSGNAAATTSLGETVAVLGSANFLSLSNFTSTAGLPPPGSVLNGQITGSGTQGGAFTTGATPTATNGTNISGTTFSSPILGGIGGAIGTDGGNGVTVWKPFFSTGGAGGGASHSGTGGRGGDGGIGCGGGAGGGGLIGGAGGKGGDGLVIIMTI